MGDHTVNSVNTAWQAERRGLPNTRVIGAREANSKIRGSTWCSSHYLHDDDGLDCEALQSAHCGRNLAGCERRQANNDVQVMGALHPRPHRECLLA